MLFQLQVAYAYKHLRDIRRHMEWGMDQFQKYKQSPTPGVPVSFWELIELQEEARAVLMTGKLYLHNNHDFEDYKSH